MYTFCKDSPVNSQVEDFAISTYDCDHIPDDTIILVSKNTSVMGGAFRVVQIQNGLDGSVMTVVVSFDDNFGVERNGSYGKRVRMKWSLCTDFYYYSMGIKNGIIRFTPKLKDLLQLDQDIVSQDSWEMWIKNIYDQNFIKELEGLLNEIIPLDESIGMIELSYLSVFDFYIQQVELNEFKAVNIVNKIGRYKNI